MSELRFYGLRHRDSGQLLTHEPYESTEYEAGRDVLGLSIEHDVWLSREERVAVQHLHQGGAYDDWEHNFKREELEVVPVTLSH